MTRKGVRLGIELMQPAGKNNGTIEVRSQPCASSQAVHDHADQPAALTFCDLSFREKGNRYFTCADNHGLLTLPAKVQVSIIEVAV